MEHGFVPRFDLLKTLWSASILLFRAPCPLPVPNREYREFSTLPVNGLVCPVVSAELISQRNSPPEDLMSFLRYAKNH